MVGPGPFGKPIVKSLLVATLLLTLGSAHTAAQDVRQLLQQLRSGSDEARMAAFYKLVESGKSSAPNRLPKKEEIVRGLVELSDREQKGLLDPSRRFTPEQMQYFSLLYDVTATLRDPSKMTSALSSLSAAAPRPGDLTSLMSRASAAGVSNKEMQIVMSGLLRLVGELNLPASIPR